MIIRYFVILFICCSSFALDPIYNAHTQSGISNDAEIQISILKIKRGNVEDIGDDAEFFVLPQIITFKDIKNENGQEVKTIARRGERNLPDTNVVSVGNVHRNSFEHVNSTMTLKFSEINKGPLFRADFKDRAELKLSICEDDIPFNQYIAETRIEIGELTSMAEKNPFGFKKIYILKNKELRFEAEVELKVTMNKNEEKLEVVNDDHRFNLRNKVPSANSRISPSQSSTVKER